MLFREIRPDGGGVVGIEGHRNHDSPHICLTTFSSWWWSVGSRSEVGDQILGTEEDSHFWRNSSLFLPMACCSVGVSFFSAMAVVGNTEPRASRVGRGGRGDWGRRLGAAKRFGRSAKLRSPNAGNGARGGIADWQAKSTWNRGTHHESEQSPFGLLTWELLFYKPQKKLNLKQKINKSKIYTYFAEFTKVQINKYETNLFIFDIHLYI